MMRRSANDANASLAVAGVDPDPTLVLDLASLRRVLPRDLFAPRANVAKRGEDLLLFARVIVFADLAELEHHLQFDEPLLPRLIVEQLFVGHRLNLFHDPAKAGHRRSQRKEEDVVEEKHEIRNQKPEKALLVSGFCLLVCYLSALSSLRRMLTKL